MSTLKRLAGETVLYGFGSIIPRFLNFMLVRLHTAVFAAQEYGIITKLFAYVAVINTIFMFGMETAYFRFANKAGADEKRVFNITQTVVLLISGSLSIIFILFAKQIAYHLDVESRPDLVSWLVVLMFIDAAVAIPFARMRFFKKALQFASGKLVNVLILVGLNYYFLKIAYDGTTDVGFVILANLIANAFYIFFCGSSLIRWRPTFDNAITPEVFRYSFPIMITGLAGMTNEMFSRISLEDWLPKNFYPGKSTDYVMGIFGAAYKFAVLMNLAIQAFRYAAEPFFFSQASEKNSPQLFARVNHYFVIVCCLLLVGVSVNLDIIKFIFLKRVEYWEGLHIVPVLLLAYLFLGVYYNMSVWFKLTDKTYFGTIITLSGAIITIAANWWLIPIAGYDGSAAAALICYAFMTIACYVLGQRHFPIPYNISAMFAYIFVSTAIAYAVPLVKIESQLIATTFHGLTLLAFVGIIYIIERKRLFNTQA